MVTNKTAFDILAALEGQEQVDEESISELPEDEQIRQEREAREIAQQKKAQLQQKQQQQLQQQQQQDRTYQVPPRLTLPWDLIQRTRMCDEWVRTGRCKRGKECDFAHDVQEKNRNCARVKQYQAEQYAKMGYTAYAVKLAAAAAHLTGGPMPPALPAAAAPPPPQRPVLAAYRGPMYKTRLCRHFVRHGDCPAGAECGFAHGEHELRAPGGQGVAPPPPPPPRHGAGGSAGAAASSSAYSYIDAPYRESDGSGAGPSGSGGGWWAGGGAAGPSPSAGGVGPREMDELTLAALMSGLEFGEEEDEHFAFLCPITQERMQDPVVAADGYSYERSAIEAWLATRDTSPMTNEALEDKLLIPNMTLREAMRVVLGE